MAAAPTIGYTATATIGGSPLAFPIMIEPPTGTVGTVEASYMGMASRDKRWLPTLYDNDDFVIEGLYCEADWRALWALRGVATTIVVTFVDDGTGTPPTWSFSGILTKVPLKFEMEGVNKFTATFKVSGLITLT